MRMRQGKRASPVGATVHQAVLTAPGRLRGADDAGLEVGVAVAVLGVVQPHAARDELAQQVHDVGLHALVPVLLDHDRGGGALGVDVHQPVAHARARGDGPHRVGDVDELLARAGAEPDDLAHGPAPR